ncbi:SDR family NAD(P)-dependent oxidoreductase, partial [Streptomyces sp. SID1121]|uniref:SDR family NAD(P)-dependent oxidoreductase n=1 Tax=Streptomyces sp. SID1121 TaxID=3425888 RepID=UPI0040564CA3
MTDRPIECRVVLTDTDFIMRNHRVHGVPVMPGVTFLDILLRILRSQGLDHERAVFGRILFTEAVATTEGMDREIRIAIGAADGRGERPVTVDSRWSAVPGSPWRENLTAVLSFGSGPGGTAQPETIDVDALRAGAVRTTDMAELYARARDEDIRHGPAMACHGPLHIGDGYLLAELSTGEAAPDAADFHLHPALLDAATIAAYGQTEVVSREPFIPMHIGRFRAPRSLGRTMYLYVPGVERLADSGDVIRSDYGLYDEQGLLAAEFGALTCKRIRRPDLITRLLDEPRAHTGVAVDGGTGADGSTALGTAMGTAMGTEAGRAADPVTAYTAQVRRLVGDALGVDPAAVDSGTGFYELGLDSADLVRISGLLEEVVGSPLYPTLLFEFTHIDSLATHLAEAYPQGATALRPPSAEPTAPGAATAGSGSSAGALPASGGGRAASGVALAGFGSSARALPALSGEAAAPGAALAGAGLSAAALLASDGGHAAAGRAPAASGLSAAALPAHGVDRSAAFGTAPSASGPAATALFRPCWYEAPATARARPDGDLVVFAPDGEPAGFTAELAALAANATVVRVGPGPVFEQAGAAGYRLDVTDPAQLDLLWSALDARGVRPAALVVLAAQAGITEPDAPALTLLRLARSLTGRPAAYPVPAILFVHPAPDGGGAPEHLAVGALARCVTAEAPALVCRAVGVDRWTADAVADAVLAELAVGEGCPQSRHIAGRRELRGLAPAIDPASATAPDPATAPGIDPDSALTLKRHGVYVVTGGGGALASTLATHLAARYAARIALIGRRPMGDELAARTDTWRALGAEVAYLTADVTRPADVEAALALVRERFGPLDGVFHTAGVTADSLFRTKPDNAPTAVVLPKALGALNLDRATAGDPLHLFVLYSSLSASQATPGQSDYAFANAWLEHFAEARSARADRPGRTHAIGWPMWAEGGMRLTPDAIEHSRRTRGTWPMPTPEGLELLERVLAGPEGVSVAVYGSPDRVAQPFADADTAPYQQPRYQQPPNQQPPHQAPDQAPDQAPHPPTKLTGDVPPAAATPANVTGAAKATEADAIAIIGLAGQYPQAPDLDVFWRNLTEGRDSITTVPEERWDHTGYFAPERGRTGSTYSRWGGFLDGVDLFDREFFGISRRDAERMDPQERLFLTVCWRALEDAGLPAHTLGGETVGVFAGVMWNHYQLFQDRGVAPTAMHAAVPNRVSYTFGLTGPSMAVDTACSSSLTAIHLAVESLRRGETSLALAGGVNVTVHPQKYLQLAQGQFLSDDGRCRSFGAGATGYVPGEGVGAVLLKPLRQALADGDHIHGVIRASAANHSGRTSGFTVPSPDSQAVLIRTALHRSGVDPRTIGYIEAHGTGTSLGDPVEIEGLRQAFAGTGAAADGGVAVGSVKSNIGHLESAAGIAALTKVLLQLRHGRLVPSLHSRELNPHLDLAGSPLRIQREGAEWPRPADGSPRRAGISAFGAGGAGAHLVVEGYDGAVRPTSGPGGPLLFVLSAPDPAGLRAYAHALRAHLDAGPGPAPDEGARTATLVRLSAELLGVREDQVDPDAWLGDLGLDPSSLLELARRIEEELAFAVPPDALAPDGSLRRIAKLAPARPAPGAGPDPVDLAHTLQVGRTARPYRLAIVADDQATALHRLREALDAFLTGTPPDDAGYVTGGPDNRTTDGTTGRPSPEECAALFRQGRLRELAAAWAAGAEVRWHEMGGRDGGPAGRRIPLPTHPLSEERCWLGQWRGGPKGPAAVEDGGGEAGRVRQAESGPYMAPDAYEGGRTAGQRPTNDAPAAATNNPTNAPTNNNALHAPTNNPTNTPMNDPAVETRILDPGIALVVMRTSSNMFTEETVRGLEAAFAELSADDNVRAVVLTGAGPAFSMGGTPEALERLAGGRGSFTDVPFLYEGLLSCDRPVIAALSGHASGGGLMFGLHADMVLMAREGMYAASFLKYGFTPGMGATYVLERRFGRSLATEMFYTGRPFSGAELERRGAQVTFLPRDEVLPAALDLARTIASRPTRPVRALKRELADRTLGELNAVITREAALHRRVLGKDALTRVQNHTAKVRGYAHPTPTPRNTTPQPSTTTPAPHHPSQPRPTPTHSSDTSLQPAASSPELPDTLPQPTPPSPGSPDTSPLASPSSPSLSLPTALSLSLASSLPSDQAAPDPGSAYPSATAPVPGPGSTRVQPSASAPTPAWAPDPGSAQPPAPLTSLGSADTSLQPSAIATVPGSADASPLSSPSPLCSTSALAPSSAHPLPPAPTSAPGLAPVPPSGPVPAPVPGSLSAPSLSSFSVPAPSLVSAPSLAPAPSSAPAPAAGLAPASGLASAQDPALAPPLARAQVAPPDQAPPLAAAVAPQGDVEVTLPRTVNPAPQRDAVIAVVMDTLCGHLYLDPNEIDPQLTFSEMGVDSLGAVEIVRDLNQHFGLDLDSVAVYDHPTLDRLANFVDAESARGRALHAAAVRPHSPAVVAEAPEEPQVSQAPGAEAPYLPGAEDADAPGAVAEAPSAAARSVAGDAAFSQAVPPKTPVGGGGGGGGPGPPGGHVGGWGAAPRRAVPSCRIGWAVGPA